jgi:hypothetical protein
MQKLAEICVRRPVFATVIVLILTVIGGFSFFTLGVDRFPKIDIPTVSVSTSNTGAAPQEIETEITDIIEGVGQYRPRHRRDAFFFIAGSIKHNDQFQPRKGPRPGYPGGARQGQHDHQSTT